MEHQLIINIHLNKELHDYHLITNNKILGVRVYSDGISDNVYILPESAQDRYYVNSARYFDMNGPDIIEMCFVVNSLMKCEFIEETKSSSKEEINKILLDYMEKHSED